MRISDYQREAGKTDQVAGESRESVLVPLLGLAGEVGTLLSEYKKFLRDGHAHSRFKEQVAEDLGDLLWYVANVATKFGLDLDAVAQANLEKTQSRWPSGSEAGQYRLFDETFPANEQIPRSFQVSFREELLGDAVRVVISLGDKVIGDPLTDNAPAPTTAIGFMTCSTCPTLRPSDGRQLCGNCSVQSEEAIRPRTKSKTALASSHY